MRFMWKTNARWTHGIDRLQLSASQKPQEGPRARNGKLVWYDRMNGEVIAPMSSRRDAPHSSSGHGILKLLSPGFSRVEVFSVMTFITSEFQHAHAL